MQGSGYFFDTKISKKIIAYKLLCSAITDGNYLFQLFCQFLFDKYLLEGQTQSKTDSVKQMIVYIFELF
jgi:hypothetical protein